MCSSNLSKSLSKQSLPWFKFGLCTMEVLTTALVGQWSLLNLLYSITLTTLQLDIIFGRKTTIKQNQTELYWVLSRAGDNSAEGLHSRSEQSPWSRRCTKSPNAKKKQKNKLYKRGCSWSISLPDGLFSGWNFGSSNKSCLFFVGDPVPVFVTKVWSSFTQSLSLFVPRGF